MDDTRQLRERWIGDLVFADDGFEAASSIDMAELDVRHVIRNRVLALGGRHDVGGRYEQELGLRVDKSLDEPGAGNPIDVRIRAGDVFMIVQRTPTRIWTKMGCRNDGITTGLCRRNERPEQAIFDRRACRRRLEPAGPDR